MFFGMSRVVETHSYVVTGTVISEKESNYSSTSVSTNQQYHITSKVHHHQEQILWYQSDDGREDSVRLSDANVEFREGHKIALVFSRQNNQLMRALNLTTGYYWRINYKTQRKGIAQTFALFLFTYPILFCLSLIAALPFINIITAIIVGLKSVLNPNHHYPITAMIRLLGITFFVSVIAFWLTFLVVELKLVEYYPLITRIDFPSLPYIGSTPPHIDLMMMLGFAGIVSIFLLLGRDMSLNLSISAALDQKSSRLLNKKDTS